MSQLRRVLTWIDDLAPHPWIVEGVEQKRPLNQIITFIIIFPIGLWLITKFLG